jgi:hypothetical protein
MPSSVICEMTSKLRLAIGVIIVMVVWALYIVRVTLGVGPMHDYGGNQAPALHYLVGALIVTAMVTIWIVVRAMMMGRK